MSTSVDYVALPADFRQVMWNDITENMQPRAVVFVGDGNNPERWKLIPKALARRHEDLEGYAYIDFVTNRLYFTKQPTVAEEIQFDYVYKPDDLTASDEPVFTDDKFAYAIVHGMMSELPVIDGSEKSFSYRDEHLRMYNDYLTDMALEDARHKLNF
jgi:hypothetical protein